MKAILWGLLVEWWYSRLFSKSKIGKRILKEHYMKKDEEEGYP